MTPSPMVERYQRAARITPAGIGPSLTGALGDGYWLDDRHFFFCVIGAIAEGTYGYLPKIVDAVSGEVKPVLEIAAIAALISKNSEGEVAPADLAGAQYDMPSIDVLVVTLGGGAYRIGLGGPALLRVEPLDGIMSLHSPDGARACFLKEHAVWIRDRRSGVAEQLTPDGERYHAFGAAPESSITPLSTRKAPLPCGLWSADSAWFVTHRIDERHLPESGLVENAPPGGERPAAHVFKVSSLDAEPAQVEFFACHPASGRSFSTAARPVNIQVASPFIFRGCWFAGDSVYFLDWERHASAVALAAMSLESGEVRTVLAETAESGWIDLHPAVGGLPMVRPLPASGELIWCSQRDGAAHLYLHDLADGTLKAQITRGEWAVREIVHVDEARRRLLFLASGFEGQTDPTQRRLCAVGFDGGAVETVLALEADIAAKPDPLSGVEQLKPFRPSYAASGASPDGGYVVASVGAADLATRFVLIETESGRQTELSRIDIDARWTAPQPQPFRVIAADGVTRLNGAMYFPSDFDPQASYPLVDYIYPGPQMNWFARRFPNPIMLSLQAVAELGAVGIILETRGMPGRDRAFHQAGGGHLLEPQLSDHVAAVEQLCRRHAFLDRDRIGIFGQSGGGHAAARALFDYPQVFKVGVAVCGNHDNRNYIAHWIDKYGGRPGSAERDSQSNVEVAHKLQGRLLLMHGDMDDNVHPGHTLAVCAALIAAGKDFDQLIVPGATHAILYESPYAVQKLWSFFVRYLIGAEPPADFALRWRPSDMAAALRTTADIV